MAHGMMCVQNDGEGAIWRPPRVTAEGKSRDPADKSTGDHLGIRLWAYRA